MLICQYCGRECKNAISHSAHQRTCPKNPNRRYKNGMVGKKGGNQFTKAKQLGVEQYGVLSEAGAQKIRETNAARIWDDEMRLKMSESMKRAVAKNPQAYTSSNRGRCKQIVYDGVVFHSSWELEFYKWCQAANIICIRNCEGFRYIWEGERTYFPDFYLPGLDLYIEVKGYTTERDFAKWRDFTKSLRILTRRDIMAIKKNKFKF